MSARATSPTTGLPQVNLLPPEIRAARSLKVVKRWLALALGVVVLLIGGVFAFSLMSAGLAEQELADAQADTQRLKLEEAQYAEVPLVLTALEDTERAREIGMSTEVNWKSYLDAITAVLPQNVSVDSISFSGATPVAAPPLPASPLHDPSVGSLQFSGRTATIPDISAWVDALNSVPGFSDAWVNSSAVAGEEGTVYYEVESVVQVTDAAYTHRFDATEEES